MTANWNGVKSGDWSDKENWADGKIPQDGDDIAIPAHRFGATAPAGFRAGDLSMEGPLYGGPVTVTGRFHWTGGALGSPIVLPTGATGQVTVGPADMELLAAITIAGDLEFDGSGTLSAGNETTLVNTGRLTFGDGITLTHTGGALVGVTTTGDLRIGAPAIGSPAGFRTTGGGVPISLDAGTVTIDGELVADRGTTVSLRGATLAGSGTIRVTSSAALDVAATTVVPESLTVQLEDANFGTAPGAPADTRLHVDGTVAVGAGSISGPALHVRRPGTLRLGPSTTAWFQSDVVITNDGALDVPADTVWNLQGEATLHNAGVTTLHSGATLNGGRVTNVGLLEVVGDGVVRLANAELVNAAAAGPLDPEARVGAVAVRGGTLRLEGLRSFAIDDGGLYLAGGRIECERLRLEGGYLTGGGTLHGTLSNNSWIELGQPGGLTVDGDLECDTGGHLVVPTAVWLAAGAAPLLAVTGRANLAGSVWAPQAPAGQAQPLHLLTAQMVVGRFDRRRAATWGARLNAVPSQSGTSAAVDLNVDRAPDGVFYGFDLLSYLSIRQRGGRTADEQRLVVDAFMGAAYENTPWSSFVMYFRSPTDPPPGFPRRTTEDALDSLKDLLGAAQQGWGIIPVYWGQNNADAPFQANPNLTSAQGRLDAADAVRCAQGFRPTGLRMPAIPDGAVLYLDIEPATATDPQRRARDYVDAWIDALAADGTYRPGVYCPHDFARGLRNAHPDLPLWVVTPLSGAAPVNADHDITPIDFSDQDVNCTVWQYRVRVPPEAGGADLQFADDHGNLVKWEAHEVDFDLATCVDPSLPNDPRRKTPRAVTALTLDAPSVTGGDSTRAVITLDRAAPKPLGTAIVLRASQPEAQVPANVWIAPGQTSTTVLVSSSPVRASVSLEVSARGMHQLDTEPRHASLTVEPAHQ